MSMAIDARLEANQHHRSGEVSDQLFALQLRSLVWIHTRSTPGTFLVLSEQNSICVNTPLVIWKLKEVFKDLHTECLRQ